MRSRCAQRGVTLVELITTMTVMVILAGVALPVAHTMEKRKRELELRRTLREIRTALDEYHLVIQRFPSAIQDPDDENWPDDLDVLVEGIVANAGQAVLEGCAVTLHRVSPEDRARVRRAGCRRRRCAP